MKNCIEKILQEVKPGYYFDSHFVVDELIKNYSDDYLNFCSGYQGNNITLTVHRQIGHLIAKFEGILVERQQGQSWSVNIHGSSSECALWRKIVPKN
ncbi:MAG: hypothetical protein JW806_03260 [Sedimentisphaerales bacterium]|nr:hypothetical protein [Sedimentisphaerales bacterium]